MTAPGTIGESYLVQVNTTGHYRTKRLAELVVVNATKAAIGKPPEWYTVGYGATLEEANTVRKHLQAEKVGKA